MDQLLYGRIFGLPVWVVGLVVIGGAIAVYLIFFRNKASSSSSTLGQNTAGQQAAVPPVDQSLYDPYTGRPLAVETATNPATGLPNYNTVNGLTGPTAPGTSVTAAVRPQDTTGQFAYWDASNPQGVPIRPGPGSTTITSYAPYGSQVQVASTAPVPAQYANQGTPLAWYPVAGGGYINAADLTSAPHGGAAGPYQATPWWPVMMDMPVRRGR